MVDAIRYAVVFEGNRDGVERLTWAQDQVLRNQRDLASLGKNGRNPGFILPVPTACTRQAVLAAIGRVLSRHEALRTKYLLGQDPPLQLVFGSGSLEVEICLANESEAAGLAEKILWNFKQVRFLDSSGWPVRISLVESAGFPRSVVLVASHLSLDGWAIQVVADELMAEIRNPGSLTPRPAPVRQPLDRARFEASSVGMKRSKRSLKYYEETLRKVPRTPFLDLNGVKESGTWNGGFLTSTAIAHAAQRIAQRAETTVSPVILAAFAAVFAVRAGNESFACNVLIHNRFEKDYQGFVGQLAQATIMAVAISAEDSFWQLVRKTMIASQRAYRNGCFDRAGQIEIQKSVALDRGMKFEIGGYSYLPRPTVPRPVDFQVGVDADKSLYDSRPTTPRGKLTKYHVEARGDHRSMVVSLEANPSVLSATAVRDVLLGVQRVLIQGDERDILVGEVPSISGIAPIGKGSHWSFVDGCWIDPAAIRRCILSLPEVQEADVFVVSEGRAKAEVVAFLVVAQREASISQIHERVVEASDCRGAVMAPHRYIVCDGPPPGENSFASWSRKAVRAIGTGR